MLDRFSALEQARIAAVASDYGDALAEYVFRDTVGLGWGDALAAGDGAQEPLPEGLEVQDE